jgi:hypothetical protein
MKGFRPGFVRAKLELDERKTLPKAFFMPPLNQRPLSTWAGAERFRMLEC